MNCRGARAHQRGFTLVELLIGLTLSAVILAAGAALLNHMLVATGDSADKTLARMQLQYVSFWVGEDVAQAQSISLGNSTVNGGNVTGFPIVLEWADPFRGNSTVTYEVEGMTDEFGRQLLKLNRVKEDFNLSGETYRIGNVTVSEYLVYAGSDPGNIAEREFLKCYQKETVSGNETAYMQVLVLEVTSWVDRQKESARFEIQPRIGNVTWTW